MLNPFTQISDLGSQPTTKPIEPSTENQRAGSTIFEITPGLQNLLERAKFDTDWPEFFKRCAEWNEAIRKRDEKKFKRL